MVYVVNILSCFISASGRSFKDENLFDSHMIIVCYNIIFIWHRSTFAWASFVSSMLSSRGRDIRMIDHLTHCHCAAYTVVEKCGNCPCLYWPHLTGEKKALFGQMLPDGLKFIATTKSLDRYVPSPNNDVCVINKE